MFLVNGNAKLGLYEDRYRGISSNSVTLVQELNRIFIYLG